MTYDFYKFEPASIMGSKPLKKAMIDTLMEIGFKPYSNSTLSSFENVSDKVITFSTTNINNKCCPSFYADGTITKHIVFNLPTDWDAVIEYATMLLIPSKYKVGDLVVVSDSTPTDLYQTAFRKDNFTKWRNNPLFSLGTKARIISVDIDEYSNLYYVLLSEKGDICIANSGCVTTEKEFKAINVVNLLNGIKVSNAKGIETMYGKFPFDIDEVRQMMSCFGDKPGVSVYIELDKTPYGTISQHLDYASLQKISKAWDETH